MGIAFFGHPAILKPQKAVRKIFIDLGHHKGQGLREFVPKLGIDHSWPIYCWEANPNSWKYMDVCPVVDGRPLNVVKIHAAALDYTGVAEMALESNNGANDGWGSSVIPRFKAPGLDHDKKIKVPCIRFAEWLASLACTHIRLGDGCEIHIKMDIEGSEFRVLRDILHYRRLMTPDGPKLASMISSLHVEWHERFMQDLDAADIKKMLVEKLSQSTEVHNHW